MAIRARFGVVGIRRKPGQKNQNHNHNQLLKNPSGSSSRKAPLRSKSESQFLAVINTGKLIDDLRCLCGLAWCHHHIQSPVFERKEEEKAMILNGRAILFLTESVTRQKNDLPVQEN